MGDTGIQNKQNTEDTRIQGYKRNKDKGDRGIKEIQRFRRFMDPGDKWIKEIQGYSRYMIYRDT